MDILDLAMRDVKKGLDDDACACLCTLLYACTLLGQRGKLPYGLTDRAELATNIIYEDEHFDNMFEINGEIVIKNCFPAISTTLERLQPQQAIDVCCAALSLIALTPHQHAKVKSTLIVLDDKTANLRGIDSKARAD